MYTAADAEVQKHKEDHVDELIKDACLRACSEYTRQTMQHSQYHFLWQIPKCSRAFRLLTIRMKRPLHTSNKEWSPLVSASERWAVRGFLDPLNEETMSDFSSRCLRQQHA